MALSYTQISTSTTTNWTLLSTVTPTAVSSYTFSSLSGYSKYRVIGFGIQVTSSASFGLQLNGDSGSNYQAFGNYFLNGYPSSLTSLSTTYFFMGATNGTATYGAFTVDIENALNPAPKIITSTDAYSSTGIVNVMQGHYKTSSALTSITVIADTSGSSHAFTNGTGTFYLLGAN